MAVTSLATRPLFWGVVLTLAIGAPLAVTLARRPAASPAEAALPAMGTVGDFALTDQRGAAVTAQALRGHVWVANFIFTRCPSICPAFTAKMGQIQERTAGAGDAIRLVSFSVDPEHDTPAALAAYATAHQAGPHWTFLTGGYDAMRATVEAGMKQEMDRQGKGDDPATIVHSPFFVLVDRELTMRGFYDMNDPDAVDRVVRDAKRLLR